MKKVLCIMLFFFNSISFSQTITIPDSNLLYKLTNANFNNPFRFAKNSSDQWIKIDINNDGQIQQSEALLVTKLYLRYESSIHPNIIISNLTGLQNFSNLEYIEINLNSVTNIDLLSVLTNLIIINAYSCNINSINLTGLSSLKSLNCNSNNISQINLSGLNSLEFLDFAGNNLSTLNLNGLINLKALGCDYNSISSLDLSNNPLLTILTCRFNNLTSLNIKNGVNHDFSTTTGYINDCWKTGNPNLATICVDASELTSVQNHLNNCGSAQTINITSNCGLGSEEFVANEVVLYPNPTSSVMNINSSETIKSIELYDSLGRVLVSKIIENNQTSLELSTYSNGIYFVKISTENGDRIEKVVKQ